jgi:two-component system, cell cycle response regulator DivK
VRLSPAVLIVDDYPDTIEMYAAYLELVGFRPIKANNGYEALRVASVETPDVILMDLSLPGLDGVEVTRRLKGDPRTAHIPVIALTAHAAPHQPEQLLAIGFHALIMKPCLPDALADEVTRVLSTAMPRRAHQGDREGVSQSAA